MLMREVSQFTLHNFDECMNLPVILFFNYLAASRDYNRRQMDLYNKNRRTY